MKTDKKVQEYFGGLEKSDRLVLLQVWSEILDCLRNLKFAEDRLSEKISYGMPAICIDGKACFGLAVFAKHYSFFPFSRSILQNFEVDLRKSCFVFTESGLHFTENKPIPKTLLKKIIKAKLKSI
jgi:uncharacterized protein YdhG (YjbR/CyaY superfamily)